MWMKLQSKFWVDNEAAIFRTMHMLYFLAYYVLDFYATVWWWGISLSQLKRWWESVGRKISSFFPCVRNCEPVCKALRVPMNWKELFRLVRENTTASWPKKQWIVLIWGNISCKEYAPNTASPLWACLETSVTFQVHRRKSPQEIEAMPL